MCLEEWQRILKDLRQDIRSPSQDLNRKPTEHEAGVPPARPRG